MGFLELLKIVIMYFYTNQKSWMKMARKLMKRSLSWKKVRKKALKDMFQMKKYSLILY
jgi:hypothetical protein